MKKISGPLKLSLAAYRELATFAKFGSDLDSSTKQQLDKGERLVEMLKQNESSPLPFYQQSVIIYAGVNGYLETIAVSDVGAFEKSIVDKLETTHSDLKDAIIKEKALTDDIENQIKELIQIVIQEFSTSST